MNGFRAEQVSFTILAPLIISTNIEGIAASRAIGEGVGMTRDRFFSDYFQICALDAGSCPSEVFLDYILIESNGFKDLSATIALDGRDTDFRSNLGYAFSCRLDEVLASGFEIDIDQEALIDHVFDGFKGKIGINRAATIANQEREVMHFSRFARFED